MPLVPILVPVLIVAGLGAAISGGFIAYSNHRAQRRAQFEAFADYHGWTYTEADPSLAARWGQHSFGATPFGAGRAEDIISGTDRGRAFVAFTSAVTRVVSTGKTTTTTTDHYTVVVLRLGHVLPPLVLTPESLGSKILKLFGGRDLEVGDKAFDKTYKVQAYDADYARTFLGPPLVAWLMEKRRAGRPFAIAGGDLLTWQDDALDHNLLPGWLNELHGFADLINPDVLGQYAQPEPGTPDLR